MDSWTVMLAVGFFISAIAVGMAAATAVKAERAAKPVDLDIVQALGYDPTTANTAPAVAWAAVWLSLSIFGAAVACVAAVIR